MHPYNIILLNVVFQLGGINKIKGKKTCFSSIEKSKKFEILNNNWSIRKYTHIFGILRINPLNIWNIFGVLWCMLMCVGSPQTSREKDLLLRLVWTPNLPKWLG